LILGGVILILIALGVYDKKGEYYHPPFFCRTSSDGRRVFQRLCTDSETSISSAPADFDLQQIGTFDDSNGVYSPVSPSVFLCNGASVVP